MRARAVTWQRRAPKQGQAGHVLSSPHPPGSVRQLTVIVPRPGITLWAMPPAWMPTWRAQAIARQ